MAQKPSIPKGTRDFTPVEMAKRNFIFDTIRNVFRLYGFQPIETPAMENLSTLLGKYGEEGDKLLFRILNSGDFLSGIPSEFEGMTDSSRLSGYISEKGLRYDLTVPFARFVVQYRNEITFPFKRYQIQPVWRADRPQKGRYREFYQCDVDVIGSDSLLNEAELVQIIDDVFRRLSIRAVVKINNRKVLAGISEIIGQMDRLTDITVAIDKMEKIGLEKVADELSGKGVSEESIRRLKPILLLDGNTNEKLDKLTTILSDSETGLKGVAELRKLFGYIESFGLSEMAELDLTLARGLNYYTGAIFEVKAIDVNIGSICGGGRYDDLTGIFGMPGVSGVGISFGAERIYDVLDHLDLFPSESMESPRALFVNFGSVEEAYILPMLNALRKKGINVEIYPDADKMKKQFNYANRKNIPYVVLVGEAEISANMFTMKDMVSGDQKMVSVEELTKVLCDG
jgi:histidyl-tRNA synthetase